MNRLKEKYEKEIRPALIKELGIKNQYDCPTLKKVVIASGVGTAASNKKDLEGAIADLTAICGQKPIVCKAKKSVSAFKIRQGQDIGVKLTLRGERMYQFLDKFFNIVLPRVRDFQGLSLTAFDGQGNYSIGVPEQIVFLEIEFGKIDRIRGFQITVVTTARSNEQAKALLEKLGLPFEKPNTRR